MVKCTVIINKGDSGMPTIDLSMTQKHINWLADKIYLNSIAGRAANRKVYRGQVYRCKLGVGIGSEESKERPCVILQYDGGNKRSPNTIVAPITHTGSGLNIVVPIADKYDGSDNLILDGNVLLGNVVCISKARIGDYLTDLLPSEMKQVDYSLAISLGLYPRYETKENELKDKLNYIEKLKNKIKDLETEVASLGK